jgi:putative ABC transport system ATP-binding protein
MDEYLSLTNISKQYRLGSTVVQALRDLNLTVPKGGYLAITGPSGSGKSSVLNLVAGLDSPTAGHIILDGTRLHGLSEAARCRLRAEKIGMVFQSFHLNPALTASENVILTLRLLGTPKRLAEVRARESLELVGLDGRRHHRPAELSGGERQRVALARAFAKRPALLLADEPTGSLDTANGMMVAQLLKTINRRHGTTIVLVTHNLELAAGCDRTVVLRDGTVLRG